MENFRPNSYKAREEKQNAPAERKVRQKVVSGPVKVKKKNGLQKFANEFVSEDLPKVKNFAISEVLIPSLKKAISDIVRNGIDIFLYGDSQHNKNSNSPANKVSYRSYYNNQNNNAGFRTPTSRTTYSYDDIWLSTRGEAEQVLFQMDEIISTYGFVSVADLYDLVGITGSYTDNNYGWTDLRSAGVVRVQDGYLLKFPKVVPYDQR